MLGKRKKPKLRDSGKSLVFPNVEMLEDLGFVKQTSSIWIYQIYSSGNTDRNIVVSKMSIYLVNSDKPKNKQEMVFLWKFVIAGEISSKKLVSYIKLLEEGTSPSSKQEKENSPC